MGMCNGRCPFPPPYVPLLGAPLHVLVEHGEAISQELGLRVRRGVVGLRARATAEGVVAHHVVARGKVRQLRAELLQGAARPVDEEEQVLRGGGEVGVRVEDAKLRPAGADRREAAAAGHEGGVASEGVDVQAAEERALLLGHRGGVDLLATAKTWCDDDGLRNRLFETVFSV